MIPWILKNRIITAIIVLVVVLVCWLGFVYGVAIPDAEKRGAAVATAKISQDFAVAQGRRVAETLEKERARTAEFAAMQAKIEKERIHAKTVINSLRSELDRVQQYARNQGGRRNLPTTDSTAGASDESVAKGWALFGKCTAEYAGMAEVADQQRNDLAEWQAYGRIVSGE